MKILYTDLVVEIVFLLYLLDNESSKLIVIFRIVGIIVTLWKIKKTIKVIFKNSFPFIGLEHYEWYKNLEQVDSNAIHYMYYLLVPLFAIYVLYKIYFINFAQISWYSFVLESFVAFIVLFGFIRMTPQLYINYKLKSVDHLPWKTLIYRFLSTIVDDFFAFMITMPWLQRAMYFRDGNYFSYHRYHIFVLPLSEKNLHSGSK